MASEKYGLEQFLNLLFPAVSEKNKSHCRILPPRLYLKLNISYHFTHKFFNIVVNKFSSLNISVAATKNCPMFCFKVIIRRFCSHFIYKFPACKHFMKCTYFYWLGSNIHYPYVIFYYFLYIII